MHIVLVEQGSGFDSGFMRHEPTFLLHVRQEGGLGFFSPLDVAPSLASFFHRHGVCLKEGK